MSNPHKNNINVRDNINVRGDKGFIPGVYEAESPPPPYDCKDYTTAKDHITSSENQEPESEEEDVCEGFENIAAASSASASALDGGRGANSIINSK